MTTPAPQPVTQLVTIDDALAHLNINPSDDDFDLDELQRFIDAATVFVQKYTGPIIGTQFTETHSGGGNVVCLWSPPVYAVLSVIEYVGLTPYPLTQTDLTTDGGAYAYSLDSPNSGILRRRWSGNLAAPFAAGDHNVVVTYVAGRLSVPGDVRMATLEDIRGLYTQTQYPAGSGVGGGLNGFGGDEQWESGGRNSPIKAFPRLAALLDGPTARTPSIA